VAYDLEELTLHFIFPSFRLEFVGDSKHLLNSPSDVPARLSPKAVAGAQLLRAHGLSGGQAEPKPS
jgi:hypothetical protein